MLSRIIRGFKILSGCAFALILSFSCEKSIDYQLQNQTPEVVMYAFPMPDSILKVHGSKTTNILSLNDFEGMNDVAVSVLFDENKIIDTEYPMGVEWFDITQIIGKENVNIKVEFEMPDGSIVSGKTSIPKSVKIVSIDTSSIVVLNSDNEEQKMLRCLVELNDPSNELNYYQIRVDSKKWIIEGNNKIVQKFETIQYIKEDKVFLIRDDESVLLSEVDFQGTFNDFLFEGNNYKIKLLIPEEFLVSKDGEIKNILSFYLYSLTVDYYSFIRSSIAEEAYRKYPFFERVNVYSNVANGLGVVAGLSVDIDSITIFDRTNEQF